MRCRTNTDAPESLLSSPGDDTNARVKETVAATTLLQFVGLTAVRLSPSEQHLPVPAAAEKSYYELVKNE